MKSKHLIPATLVAAIAMTGAANAAVIDSGTVNGGHLTGTTLADDGLMVAANGTTQASEGMTTNDSGRAFIAAGTNGEWIEVDGWRMTRDVYSGGNNAMGWDAGNLVGTEPAQYVFLNASTATLASDVVAGSWGAGTVFDLSYWTEMTSDSVAGSTTPTLIFSTGETHTFSAFAADETASQFSDSYTLLAAATSVQVSIAMSVPGSGAPQLKLDSVVLVPEPSVALVGGLGLLGLLRRRR